MTRLDFDPDLQRLGDALRASTTTDLAREQPAAHVNRRTPGRVRLSRPRFLAGGSLALAGVGAALVLALGGSTASPAFAVTRASDGSVLVNLNYVSGQNLGQANAKLASMGTHEQIGIDMAAGAASVSGPVTCGRAPSASGPVVKVLVGANGTEVIGPGQSGGNTAEGSFHMVSCTVTADTGSGNTGNS